MGVTAHFVNFRDYPVAYGRVPKVANSSIKAALIRLLSEMPEKGIRTQSDAFWRKETNEETNMLSPEKAWRARDGKFVFAFVRNPFDRLVSSYSNKIIDNPTPTRRMMEAGYSTRMAFEDFLKLTAEVPDSELDVHIMPQSQMLLHNGKIIPHFVGYFENLLEDWARLQTLMSDRSIRLIPLPSKNVRRDDRTDIREYFSNDRLISLALSKYQTDVSTFYPGISADQLVSGEFDVPSLAKSGR